MKIYDLGITEYTDALQFQRDLVRKRRTGEISDALILVEHDPVVTISRLTDRNHITNSSFFDSKNIPVLVTDRGGEITFHCPGQMVMYPIIDLRDKKRDIAFYIDFLEKTAVKSLGRIGIDAERMQGRRGVWVNNKKIGFIGIRLKQWVTFHGIAININNDIIPFLHINPCGQKNVRVTSAKEYLGKTIDMSVVKKVFAEQFNKDLNAEYGLLLI
ncbi:MAG: lipoyl(octanoyl) transferase LipB [Candidatus Omnitrophota bacterium]